jgi:hypothetical protein
MNRLLQIVIPAAIALTLVLSITSTLAQGLIKKPKKLCTAEVCLKSPEEEEAQFERQNNCIFGSQCGAEVIKTSTQCCGRNLYSGQPEPQQKVASRLNPDYDWDAYKYRCLGMRQSEAPPSEIWSQCIVGQKHSADDDYAVVSVEANGSSRSYCIDGCSTPPKVVDGLYKSGTFIFKDKDNPTGAGVGGYGADSSFYGACAAHDKCYQTCSNNDQKSCDDKLLTDSLAVCGKIPSDHRTLIRDNSGVETLLSTRERCSIAAQVMHAGLRTPLPQSKAAFKIRRQQYCQCCQ